MDVNGNIPPRIEIDPKKLQKGARAGCGCVTILLVLVVILAAFAPYTEFLWYTHDVRHPEVLTLAYSTQGTLFTFSFIVSLCVFYFSLKTAFQQSMVFLDRPSSMGQRIVTNAMTMVRERGLTLVKIIAPIFALFTASSFAGEWQKWLVSRSAVSFGKNDPLFGLDLGFFVFKLPWYLSIVSFLLSLAIVTTVLTIAVYVGLQMLAMLAKVELGRPQIRWHVSILIAAVCFTLGAQLWLQCYEFGTINSAQFTGAGYAAMTELAAQKFLAVACLIVGILTLTTVRAKVPYRIAIGGGVALGAIYLIGLITVPGIIQRVVVEPDKISKEAPYAKRAIDMTRFGLDLDRIEVKDTHVTDSPTKAELATAKTTLDNMRLWSPDIIRHSFEGSQGFRPYYSFNDVDLDRYTINGNPTMVMVSPRDIRLDGLNESARSWVNMRLQYTHGFGLVMSPVNRSSSNGQPSFLVRDIPTNSTGGPKVDEPRIYFSDYRSPDIGDDDQYALVDTKVDEFDFLTEDKAVTHRWTGGRGIPVGGLFARVAFALVLGDGNLLVSGNITSQSRLLMHRSVLTRASKLYPFLKFDADPYIVVHNGRLIWILDGYTTTDRIPYSEMVEDGNARLNYIRNSVKVTIDAYSGDTNAYAIQGDEPILKAYRSIYKGLVKDFSEFPKGLEAHLRYPEDLLRLQALALRQYHVEDTTSFLNNGDAWDIPFQRGTNGYKEMMRPYYVQMRLPTEPKEGFMQILPFTPRQKGNMAGWLAAMCDPGDYGRLILYKYTRGTLVPGPELMESNFNQNEAISNLNKLLSNDQSQIRVGNLLVIPVGQSVMYVEPLFLQSRTTGLQTIPELRKVILALKDKIVVGDTYQQALDRLFGDETPTTTTIPQTGDTKPPTTSPGVVNVDAAKVKEALGILDQAEQALKNGDFAKYGELQKQARERLRALLQSKG